ncbi:hypothetical protein ASF71_08165 [Deinococcus sp. Leaf326]|nr:hypothetical protein ASF71_08165 [Deinococcus sp. Leaf326]
MLVGLKRVILADHLGHSTGYVGVKIFSSKASLVSFLSLECPVKIAVEMEKIVSERFEIGRSLVRSLSA